ncbi:MAG: arsenate reductase (azurin) small subunit [Thaumarchaeota archaeon]|nr:arsenate reductase (azurin) small subunit [Nitrososphaerota archaeon]
MVDESNPTSEGKDGEAKETEKTRRDFLRIAIASSLVLVAGGIAAVTKSLWNPLQQSAATTGPTFPAVKVANIGDLKVNAPLFFNYPLDDEPNLLVKMGVPGLGGVGPQGDIVAFSQVCQHLGCTSVGFVPEGGAPQCNPAYKAPGPVAYCCCHGSVFDFQNAAKVIGGPSPRPLPEVVLRYDSSNGDIYAIGMKAPTIFGHDTGSNDVSADLQGGSLVS